MLLTVFRYLQYELKNQSIFVLSEGTVRILEIVI